MIQRNDLVKQNDIVKLVGCSFPLKVINVSGDIVKCVHADNGATYSYGDFFATVHKNDLEMVSSVKAYIAFQEGFKQFKATKNPKKQQQIIENYVRPCFGEGELRFNNGEMK